MKSSPKISIDQIRGYINVSDGVTFKAIDKSQAYEWIGIILKAVRYRSLKKKERGKVLSFLSTYTGYSYQRIRELASQYLREGTIKRKAYKRENGFSRRYTYEDKQLLFETRRVHNFISGNAIRKILQDEYEIYKHTEYKNIKDISVSYMYTLFGKMHDRQSHRFFGTKPKNSAIGIRAPLTYDGGAGHLNVDTVHQGDRNSEKGIYHINIVDSLTQWELIASLDVIAESSLAPVWEKLLDEFPFIILEFHSDNGSENINRYTAEILNRLNIKQLKGRPRHTNDNAQVETKNGVVIRKCMGYLHIPKMYAKEVNAFYDNVFNEHLNFHRPCAFPEEIVDHKGKIKKIYLEYMTPYQKLKQIDPEGKCLKSV